MTMFYQGSLQDGISLAVRETKAVVCFVRDDAQLSSTWEEEYFADEELAQVLGSKAVLLRLMAGTQEAGFLTSFCPIPDFPAAVVIKNGALQDYLGKTVSKDEFKRRLIVAVDGQTVPVPTPQAYSAATTTNDNLTASSSPLTATSNTAETTSQQPSQSSGVSQRPVQQRPPEKPKARDPAATKKPTQRTEPKEKAASKNEQATKAPRPPQKSTSTAASKATPLTEEAPKPKQPVPTGPPSQYRLQVRLFDGRSIRSSFSPTQTIRGDVRPWLDQQMVDDNRPYNLKHILTPLPSRTLSVTEESQTLRDLGLGSTATLVMVPVQTYTEAYSAAGSLPGRAISGVYNAVTSVTGTATGLVGSFFGYGPSAPTTEPVSAPSSSAENTRRPRPSGPNIRTLRDQQDGRGNSQLYNGNQLNFEPRNQDGRDN